VEHGGLRARTSQLLCHELSGRDRIELFGLVAGEILVDLAHELVALRRVVLRCWLRISAGSRYRFPALLGRNAHRGRVRRWLPPSLLGAWLQTAKTDIRSTESECQNSVQYCNWATAIIDRWHGSQPA
jgi:hypothetical protein